MSGRREILAAFLRLGLTAFGGPVAHVGYMRAEFVVRRGWLDESSFAELVAICQMLPGPASSQLGMAIGARRGGVSGGLLAWAGFTLPSAAILVILGLVAGGGDVVPAGLVHGLKLAAVAVVAVAVWAMARTLAPDWARRFLALGAAGISVLWSTPSGQVAVIVLGGLIGLLIPGLVDAPVDHPASPRRASPRIAVAAIGSFVGLLIGLAILRSATDAHLVAFVDAFYRAGALVFGGGHVVLPLLEATVVAPGWVSQDAFLAGYGAAQAVPGPLFSFAAYLGAVSLPAPNGIVGAVIALVAIYLPSFLLVLGALAVWEPLRRSTSLRRAISGVNAAVVGLLAATLYDPLWTTSVADIRDVLVVLAAVVAIASQRIPQVVVVLAMAGFGLLSGQ